MHRVLNNADDRASFIQFLLAGIKLPLTVEWRQGKDRTLEQNSLQWMWAGEVAKQTFEDARDVQARWKLEIGVPILQETSPDFRAMFDATIRPLPYEAQLRAMRVLGIGVTSQFKVREMVKYLDTVERTSLEAGLQLTPPNPDLAGYHKEKRAKVGKE